MHVINMLDIDLATSTLLAKRLTHPLSTAIREDGIYRIEDCRSLI